MANLWICHCSAYQEPNLVHLYRCRGRCGGDDDDDDDGRCSPIGVEQRSVKMLFRFLRFINFIQGSGVWHEILFNKTIKMTNDKLSDLLHSISYLLEVCERFTFTAKPTCPTEWWSVYSRNIGIFRTQLTGRDPKERIKELILDEHVACGCTCPPYLRHVCRGRFNEATCNCDCSDTFHAEDRKLCESSRAGYWDWDTCSCRDRSVETRGADNFRSTCLQNNELVPGWLELRLTGAFLGATLVMTVIFAGATMYYKNKLDQRLDLKTMLCCLLKSLN